MIKEKDNIIKLIMLFYLCSIFGYIYEIILSLLYNGKLISHGILYGPWLPIYGSGAILISFLNKYRKQPLLIFILSFFITGIVEYICGFVLLKYLDVRLWDYRGWFLNINGFVCLLSASCFGIGGLLILYLLLPLINVIKKVIKKRNLKIILLVINLLLFIDIFFTISNN